MLMLQQQTGFGAVAAKHNAFAVIFLLSASPVEGQGHVRVKFRNGWANGIRFEPTARCCKWGKQFHHILH